MEFGLANKTALVTGGSKGIGLETARALAREGVKVLICARRRQRSPMRRATLCGPLRRRSRRTRWT
jgi:NAD(P)-dependent dehydrogenase (short-subunit alcohol dehydrogenase family)